MSRRTSFTVCALLFCGCLSAESVLAEPATQPTTDTDLPPLTGSAVILSTRDHREDRGTYFAFARGLRGGHDAGYRYGDVIFDGSALQIRKHSGDRGSIVDLGERDWSQIDALPAQSADTNFNAKAIAGHAYAIHIDDGATEYWAILRVTTFVVNDRVEVEWLRLDATPRPEPAIKPADASRLAALLVKQDDNVDPAMLLQDKNIILQVKSGAGGGNPNRIDMLGETSIYVDSVSATPLNFNQPPKMQDDSIAYSSGGRIAKGKVFVIEHIDYSGTALGDSNGHGEMILQVGKEKLVAQTDVKTPIKGTWDGRILLRPGDERKVFVEVANTSTADVKIDGYLTTEADLAAEPTTQPATQSTTRPITAAAEKQ